ncbi:MAG: carbohydrate-binding domain-containing protein [Oscillospiraceae bacterium]|nr:carbohydrate-binding domain-containing protein [Oscillospiraceae bacterium]
MMMNKYRRGLMALLVLALLVWASALAEPEWDDQNATHIALSGAGAAIDGAGASVAGSTVTIEDEGEYVLSGEWSGSVVVDASKNDVVTLVLNGVTITGDQNAAIYAKKAEDLLIILPEGSINELADAGAAFRYDDDADEEPDAALFAKCDLAFSGAGQLTVRAGFYNGIGTKDDLEIEGGVYQIEAANHGIRGRDSVTIEGGVFTIASLADGIQSNNDEDEEKGWIEIEGGVFAITAGRDGIQAERNLTISGGDFTLITGGGRAALASTDPEESYKGLKAGGDVAVSGGVYEIDSADDALHANGNMTISGGDFTLSTGDDALHADGDLIVSGGVLDVLSSYEGFEAKTMTISGGISSIQADDDGVNIAGTDDQSGFGRFGRDQFSNAYADQWLKITGGELTIVAGADGIDVNGAGEMSGGIVNITAGTMGEGNTVDTDQGFTRTGGELTESGGNGFGGSFGGRGGFGGGGRP